jgi:hypothetical protein
VLDPLAIGLDLSGPGAEVVLHEQCHAFACGHAGLSRLVEHACGDVVVVSTALEPGRGGIERRERGPRCGRELRLQPCVRANGQHDGKVSRGRAEAHAVEKADGPLVVCGTIRKASEYLRRDNLRSDGAAIDQPKVARDVHLPGCDITQRQREVNEAVGPAHGNDDADGLVVDDHLGLASGRRARIAGDDRGLSEEPLARWRPENLGVLGSRVAVRNCGHTVFCAAGFSA